MDVSFVAEGDDEQAYTMKMNLDVGVGLGDVDPANRGGRDLQLLHSQIALPKLKVNEAAYFLRLLKLHLNDEAATLYHFNGFVTAIKSVLDVIANQADDKRAATSWIKSREAELMKNRDFNRIADLRNKSVHKGIHPPQFVFGVTFKEHLDGNRTIERILRIESVNGKEIPDAIGTMERALEAMKAVVADGESKGFVVAKKKDGHITHIDFQKEVEAGKWVSAKPQDMEMFGKRFPQIGLVQSVRPFNAGGESKPS